MAEVAVVKTAEGAAEGDDAAGGLFATSGARGDQYARCRNARNPYHKCGEACRLKILQQAELYAGGGGGECGDAPAADAEAPPRQRSADAAGREPLAPARIPGAVPIPRLSATSPEAVFAAHLEGDGSPVIVTDATQRWEHRGRLELAHLREHYGDELIFAADRAPLRTTDRPPQQTLRVRLREFVDYCEGADGGAGALREYERSPEHPFYANGWSPFAEKKELAAAFGKPYFVEDLTPENDSAARRASLGHNRLFVGPAGCRTRLHYDALSTHAWLAQLRGRKQFVLYPPSDAEALHGGESLDGQSLFDPESPDYSAFPRARAATPHACVLAPGEVLLVPFRWWHHATCLDTCVTLMRNFVNSRNLEAHVADRRAAQEREAAKERREASRRQRAAGVELPAAPPPRPEEDADADVFERADLYRKRGNDEFRRGRYREATEAYTRAIELVREEGLADDGEAASEGPLAVYLTNRAACWLKRKQGALALEDCSAVLRSGRTDAIALKALFRRGCAHETLGDADSALKDFRAVLELEPCNYDAACKVDDYRHPLHKLAVQARATPEVRARQTGEAAY